jgi:hypothetical protein
MPLDAGPVAEFPASRDTADGSNLLRPRAVTLSTQGHVGSALKLAREHLGLSVEDIGQATRVQARQVAALEAFDLEALPARPFVIGYVRAYARALGLETEAVVARFRMEAPAPDEQLRAPLNLRDQFHGRRFGLLGVIALSLLVAVIGWNVAKHAPAAGRRGQAPAPRHVAMPGGTGTAHLGAPLPAPPEASAPPTYLTPGLAGPPPEAAADAPGTHFVALGQVFGAPAAGPTVMLQARKATSLIVRGAGGAVYFARQLAAGEAWRAPADPGLMVEVGNPQSMEVFVNGMSTGDLTSAKTPLVDLASPLTSR